MRQGGEAQMEALGLGEGSVGQLVEDRREKVHVVHEGAVGCEHVVGGLALVGGQGAEAPGKMALGP